MGHSPQTPVFDMWAEPIPRSPHWHRESHLPACSRNGRRRHRRSSSACQRLPRPSRTGGQRSGGREAAFPPHEPWIGAVDPPGGPIDPVESILFSETAHHERSIAHTMSSTEHVGEGFCMSVSQTGPTTSSRRSDRMVALLAILRDRDEVALRDLAQQLGASAATIRRDVASLADQGLLVRTHGGARSAGAGAELPVNLRDKRHHDEKEAIAQAVAAEVPLGRGAIALTGGTTTAEVLRALHHRHDLTIITNSVSIGLEAARVGQQRVLITGGILRPSSLELVGSLADATFRQINVGIAIAGCDGLSVDGGLTTHDTIEAATNHAMLERASRIIAAVDGSKIGKVTLAKLADLSSLDLVVTDSTADPQELERIRQAGVAVKVVQVAQD